LTGTPEVDRLAKAIAAVKGRGPALRDLPFLPDDDPATMAVFGRGETADIPFFGSLAMRRTLAALTGLRFSDLVAMNALVGTGLDECHQDIFLRARIKGVRCRHPLLTKCLSETYGVMLYQEQLMDAVRVLGRMTVGEAERVRRAFGRRARSVYEQMEKDFVEGCVSNSDFRIGSCHEELQARKCAKRLWKFFYDNGCWLVLRAHYLAETRLAYLLTYLKAHHGKIPCWNVV
jgi:DNA polymerase-3 subunit alpha